MADLLPLLAALDSDPDDTSALAALQAHAAALDAPSLEALAATRARLRERGRPERAIALLDLELAAARDPGVRVALMMEKARILDEDLLDAAAATAAYKEVTALDKKHEDAGDALSQLALGKKNDNWKKFAAKFTAEARAATDRTLATGLYLSAAEQWGRFAPGKPEIVDLLRQSLEADPANRKASLHLERVLRAGGRWAELAGVLQQRLDAAASPAEQADLALALAEIARAHLGDGPRALALGKQVLAIDPAHPRAMRLVAHELEAAGDWAGLAGVYATALRARGGDGDPGLLLQAGMILWKRLNDLDGAEDYFRRLRRTDAAHPAALDFYRAYHGAKNEPAKLVAILRQAEKALPPAGTSPQTDSRARALAIEIAELSETGTPDKAIDAWKQMLRLDPTSTEAREALKRLYRKAERWNALLDLLKDEAERLPADDVAGKKERLFEMIAIYRDRLRQDPMVINTYNAVLKLDPDDGRAADELADKYRAMSRWQDLINVLGRKAELASVPLATRVALLREVADLWLERFNNHAQAVRPLERLIELAPTDLDAINRLKDIYGKRRQWRPLIGLLGREADLLSGAARHTKLTEMARLAAERAGDPRLAIEIHNRIIAEHGGGGDDETLAALASLYERDKRWLALAEILDRQRKRAKRPAEQVQLLEKIGAILADRAHAPAAAAQVWNEILAVDPNHAKALRTLRELYAAAGDWDGLEGLYGRLGQWDELVDALFALGDRQDDRAVRLGLFRRAAAIAARKPESDRLTRAWERVLAVEPQDADAARALIPAYTRAEKWAKLLPLREALLAQAPDDAARLAEIAEIRALTEQRLGSRALALTWTARAFELSPDDPALVDELLRLAQQPEQWREVANVLGRAADDERRPLATRLRLLRTLAELYGTQLDDDDAARTAQRKLLALTPDDPQAALAYEELSERLADWTELLASLRRRAAAASPGADRRALYARIATIEEEKLADLDAAAITVGKILEQAPGDAATLASLARLDEARGDWEGLAHVLEQQLASDPRAAGGRGALHLRLGALEEGSLDRPARGLEHYLAALALAAEGAEDAPAEHDAVAADTRYHDAAGPGRGLDEARRREVAAAVEPYLRRAADAPMLARALEVLAGGAAPGSAEALAIDRRLVGLYHQLARPERAWEAAARVVAGDPGDDEARAALTALAHDLDRAPQLAEHLAGALAARRKAGAPPSEIRALAAELG
ncbi:MAG TPA: hypothetical protein VHE35_01810, partial [Kofleriaceae bacterium]|nr:hypothetical protein [Kofleriaceae bacterium]